MQGHEQKEQRSLTLSEQTFPIIEQITAGMPGGFFIYHADGDEKLIYANQALIRMYGCESLEEFQEHTGNTFPGLVHPEDVEEVERKIRQQIFAGESDLDYVEYRIVRKDGEVRWIEDYGHFVHTELYGDIFYVFVEDATEKKLKAIEQARTARLVQERLEALEALVKAQQASQAKTMFLNNMSHDMRTPMNAIIGFAHLASTHLDDLELVRDYLNKIAAASDHLLSLINDVLDMSRIESGKVVIKEESCNLLKVLRDMQSMIQSGLEAKKLNFRLDDSALIHHDVICDRLRLDQVLLNALGNALKFTPVGGDIFFTATERPGDTEDNAVYEFCIRDTGIGMAPEFIEHIFEPFERERTSTVSGIQGTGLGMSITKNLVELMGGQIAVESRKGCGSAFTFTFTFRFGEISAEQDTTDTPSGQQLIGRRLLLAEDNELNQEIAVTILEEAGCIVDVAANGAEAVEKVSRSLDHPYEVILMDIQMPVMDGIEATKAIRAMSDPYLAKVPIIAMTANVFEEDCQRVLSAGMNGHLGKPIDIDKLFATLQSVLTERTRKSYDKFIE